MYMHATKGQATACACGNSNWLRPEEDAEREEARAEIHRIVRGWPWAPTSRLYVAERGSEQYSVHLVQPHRLISLCQWMNPGALGDEVQINWFSAQRWTHFCRHRDSNNEGMSRGYAFGDWEGGEVFLGYEDKSKPPEVFDQRETWYEFEGQRPHWMNPVTRGDRYSILLFKKLPKKAGASTGAREAKALLDCCEEVGDGTSEDWERCLDKGTALLLAVGSPEAAASALWTERRQRGQDNLKGVHDPVWEGILSAPHLAYLRYVEEQGVPMRTRESRTRTSNKPHQSAIVALDKIYSSLWKDIRKGRGLACWLCKVAHLLTHTHGCEMTRIILY